LPLATNNKNLFILFSNLEDTKGVTRSHKSKKKKQHNGQKEKEQTMIYKTLERELNIKQHKHH
jgi:hypothetical protein